VKPLKNSIASILMVLIFSSVAWADAGKYWLKTFGGEKDDHCMSAQQTKDGGFIVAGYTKSSGNGDADAWVIKLDGGGNKLWDRTFGGPQEDWAKAVQQTQDGGFIVAGYTKSFGNGDADAWVIKLDGSGNKVWEKTFGGPQEDWANAVRQTQDGGFIVAGYTKSSGKGNADAWVIKLDGSGNKVWEKTFGGVGEDVANAVRQTKDGGYIVAGYKGYQDRADVDVWVIRLDGSGNIVWEKTFGGFQQDDVASAVLETSEGNFIATGYTASGELGDLDVWVIMMDKSGKKLWDRAFGGIKTDNAKSVVQTEDGGIVIAGFTESFSKGGVAAWIIKMDAKGNKIWDRTYGGGVFDIIESIAITSDGGFIAAGFTESYGNQRQCMVLKLDREGLLTSKAAENK
jgi:hypothetical protein